MRDLQNMTASTPSLGQVQTGSDKTADSEVWREGNFRQKRSRSLSGLTSLCEEIELVLPLFVARRKTKPGLGGKRSCKIV